VHDLIKGRAKKISDEYMGKIACNGLEPKKKAVLRVY
jgi:hypothetical protein